MTESFEYRSPVNGATTGQVSKLTLDAADYDAVYSYSYDDNGNILSVSDGTYTTTYAYDSLNQLVREDNEEQGKTWTWAYDKAGNILSCSEYAYTAGALGAVLDTVSYTYGVLEWGDLLTGYDGQTITYDAIGNPLEVKDSGGNVVTSYTWEHGRQLASMTTNGSTWTYTYDANGMRTSRTNGSSTYTYVYNGSQLSQMTVTNVLNGDYTFEFFYDASGTPSSFTMNGTRYYYVTNLQGDVVAILTESGENAGEYTYNAWGQSNVTMGNVSETLHLLFLNPLRYRGYVYDLESGLYYLQSRYYSPAMGRFINGDRYTSTGQGILGNNMFVYCNNNSVNYVDIAGDRPVKQSTYTYFDGYESYSPNTEFLMAFYGVNSPSEIPEIPEGAMIFVENITSISNKIGFSIIEGRTIVMDADKYCEYTFVGVGWSKSLSMPLDRTVSQGYVYGLEEVTDYCGLFFGASGNMLSNIYGGAIASPKVYAEIVGGMSYAPSIGGSITWYMTGQSDWIYGKANMVVVTNPYQNSPLNPTPHM